MSTDSPSPQPAERVKRYFMPEEFTFTADQKHNPLVEMVRASDYDALAKEHADTLALLAWAQENEVDIVCIESPVIYYSAITCGRDEGAEAPTILNAIAALRDKVEGAKRV